VANMGLAQNTSAGSSMASHGVMWQEIVNWGDQPAGRGGVIRCDGGEKRQMNE
jgi:hypothetical protein